MYQSKTQLMLLLAIGLLISTTASSLSDQQQQQQDCTAVAKDEETMLVFSTLGGGLTAIEPLTGETRWSIDDEPTIRVPTPSSMSAHYLPDPRDGSLYRMNGLEGGLKKLPYTIPQLVASAPCRSSDGILYSGKKSDVWFLIDPKTGKREKVLGFGGPLPSQQPPTARDGVGTGAGSDAIGWATSRAVYLGRTQYTVMMYDSQATDGNSKPWNVTFFDYTAHTMAPELSKEYEFLHLTSSSSGLTATFEQKKGTPLWQKDLSSPVVAVFLLSSEGLLSVPFQTVSDEVLQEVNERAKSGNYDDLKLFETVYIGEAGNNLYAIPSLVDKSTATLPSEPSINLLGGPSKTGPLGALGGRERDATGDDRPSRELISKSRARGKNENIIILGHYQTPKIDERIKLDIAPSSPSSMGRSFWKHHELSTVLVADPFDSSSVGLPKLERKHLNTIGVQTEPEDKIEVGETNETKSDDASGRSDKIRAMVKQIYRHTVRWLDAQPNKLPTMLLLTLLCMVIIGFWYFHRQMKALQEQSQGGSQSSNSNRSGAGNGSGSTGGSYSEPIDFGDGEMRVGKINFNVQNVLGKGCEGTFVFRGSFEKREVAVKRILPGCFTLADREVALLRESDAHENVVRYFCTEQDRQFRYIAVELCAATLQDYVDGKASSAVPAATTVTVSLLRQKISALDILRQATSGLMHLHALSIVHRDIKPQNILLSLPDNRQRVRAMISDFGLCKKLNYGKASFSRRSGVTGTDGWIAPEMQRGQRATTSVDIFSLGCVFYYVLSDGFHPFGDNLKRQANILSGEVDLGMLRRENPLPDNRTVLAEEIVYDMIRTDASKRPSARAIANHPLFWSNDRVLAFLQDVSDRVEKSEIMAEPLRSLEKNARFVVREDWSRHLDAEVTADLRKFRGYQGYSVRDLLRALRNKKHHYHELTREMQRALGTIPHEFTDYWIGRFPRLLSHSYHALADNSREPIFRQYYNDEEDNHTGSGPPVGSHGGYKFTKPAYFLRDDNDNYELLRYYELAQAMKTGTKSPKRRMGGDGGSGEAGKIPTGGHNNKRGTYNFGKTMSGGFITRQQVRENDSGALDDQRVSVQGADAGGENDAISDGGVNQRRRYVTAAGPGNLNSTSVTAANQNNTVRRREAQTKVTWNLDGMAAARPE